MFTVISIIPTRVINFEITFNLNALTSKEVIDLSKSTYSTKRYKEVESIYITMSPSDAVTLLRNEYSIKYSHLNEKSVRTSYGIFSFRNVTGNVNYINRSSEMLQASYELFKRSPTNKNLMTAYVYFVISSKHKFTKNITRVILYDMVKQESIYKEFKSNRIPRGLYESKIQELYKSRISTIDQDGSVIDISDTYISYEKALDQLSFMRTWFNSINLVPSEEVNITIVSNIVNGKIYFSNNEDVGNVIPLGNPQSVDAVLKSFSDGDHNHSIAYNMFYKDRVERIELKPWFHDEDDDEVSNLSLEDDIDDSWM